MHNGVSSSGVQNMDLLAIQAKQKFYIQHRSLQSIMEKFLDNINNVNIAPSLTVRDLRVIVNSHLQMTKHVDNICNSGHLALKNIGKIRNYISQSDCGCSVHTFITSVRFVEFTYGL